MKNFSRLKLSGSSYNRYITDPELASMIYLSYHLNKPIFLEGEPGVGKTEVAIVLSEILETQLIRLQCYEGLDANTALYEWNYPKQLLRIIIDEQSDRTLDEIGNVIYSEPYLIKRPLLQAILSSQDDNPVLLIDELDRADEEFEAFLLEILSDFKVSIPEIGTIKATHKPLVVITSNRTRDIHDALKRRCLYHWIDYPDQENEKQIILARIDNIDESLAVYAVFHKYPNSIPTATSRAAAAPCLAKWSQIRQGSAWWSLPENHKFGGWHWTCSGYTGECR